MCTAGGAMDADYGSEKTITESEDELMSRIIITIFIKFALRVQMETSLINGLWWCRHVCENNFRW